MDVTMTDRCLVCEKNLWEPIYKVLLRCRSCGFITSNLDISEEELETIYNHNYFHGREYGNYIADKRIIQKNFMSRLNILLKYVNNSQKKSIFEIGSAYGFFLELANNYFKSVSGIDISADAINYIQTNYPWIHANRGEYSDYNIEQRHDIYCLWDTIEHIKRPDIYIDKIARDINADGLIALTTGDIESLNAKIQRNRWRLIHPPTHLHYFSKKTIEILLNRYGFEILYSSYASSYMSLNHIFYITLVVNKKMPQIYEILRKLHITNFSVRVNMHDVMYIIARKKN
ncbi:MAG: class I SAM-dependent methyltransferase [Candidatus Magnetominusculus sp. LBB02]|nr:class I SAM-dependent methyltransferase [Candidatus Magnetominusculus sp. LBB02]